MSVVLRELVEYIGLLDDLPRGITEVNNIQIDTFICIGDEKPNIKQASKVSVTACLENSRVVKSTTGISLDGCVSKGYKFIGEIVAKWRIEYIPDDNANTIYSLSGVSSITTFVSMPYDCSFSASLIPSVLIDDINVQILNKRTLMLNITGILIVENS